MPLPHCFLLDQLFPVLCLKNPTVPPQSLSVATTETLLKPLPKSRQDFKHIPSLIQAENSAVGDKALPFLFTGGKHGSIRIPA